MSLPKHGSSTRYKKYHCRCMTCTTSASTDIEETYDGPPAWPVKYIFRTVDESVVREDYGDEQVDNWRDVGIGDFEADNVCTFYHVSPHSVFPGYTNAGLDFYSGGDL